MKKISLLAVFFLSSAVSANSYLECNLHSNTTNGVNKVLINIKENQRYIELNLADNTKYRVWNVWNGKELRIKESVPFIKGIEDFKISLTDWYENKIIIDRMSLKLTESNKDFSVIWDGQCKIIDENSFWSVIEVLENRQENEYQDKLNQRKI